MDVVRKDGNFNPRPPARGATAERGRKPYNRQFQSTPPCAGGDFADLWQESIDKISIHAPLRGGRLLHCFCRQLRHPISIHAPLRGGRLMTVASHHVIIYFNPRPPARGATNSCICLVAFSSISIHAPLRGGRHNPVCLATYEKDFNPRPPARGATPELEGPIRYCYISIHAPLRGGRP